MKYIDADRLKAEIERLQKFNNSMLINAINSNMRNFYDGEEDCCKQLLSFINTLQQEQQTLDLDADIEMEWNSFNKHLVEYEEGSEEVIWLNWISFIDIASHFYELGLKEK